jgi:hypothetical protein
MPKNIEQPATIEEVENEKRKRPDPLFKELLAEAAREAGLKSEPTELQVQQSSTSDLLLTIPEGTALDGTLFDFFRQANIIEFKSTNDPLTTVKFALQLGRVYLWLVQQQQAQSNKAKAIATIAVDFDNILNVVVSSKYPREFLKYSAERGCPFVATPEREWLLQARCGWQDVVIVVCERLPIEPKYERWLMFAPATSQTWRSFLKMLAQEQNWELLEVAKKLRPKEFKLMSPELEKYFEELRAEEPELYDKKWWEIVNLPLPDPKYLKPEQLAQLMSKLAPEERTIGLTPEERTIGLTPEERTIGLTPEERTIGLTPEERTIGLTPEERTIGLTPEQKLELLKTLQKELGQ